MDDVEREIIRNPTAAGEKSITQIVQIIGDGKLLDSGQTAPAFRDFLYNCDVERLAIYTREIVTESSDGKIFQDIVNTIGKKIGFDVVHGLYQGKKNAIGFDGYWSHGGLNLIIECKTTDAYRISTETLLGYSKQLKEEKNLPKEPPVLLVVGRVDTGDIEAQIRGSRADDRISVIGAESLLMLAKAISELSDGPASNNLKSVLFPRDYTRLDSITALITNIINEAQQTSIDQAENEDPSQNFGAEAPQIQKVSNPKINSPADQLRERMIEAAASDLGKLEKATSRSKAQYRTASGEIYCFIASKRYERADQQFWFSISNNWKSDWEKNGGGLAIGLEGKQHFYLFNHEQVMEWTKSLNETVRTDRQYWHMALKESSDKIELILNKSETNQDLENFARGL
jgi:hypothetical protein